MTKYEDMVKSELMECIGMASEDAHADAKRKRWTKQQMVDWLEGFSELTDEAPSVAEEPQTYNADNKQEGAEDKTTFEFNGTQYQRKVKVQRRTGRRCARVAKSYVEVLDDGTAVIWKD